MKVSILALFFIYCFCVSADPSALGYVSIQVGESGLEIQIYSGNRKYQVALKETEFISQINTLQIPDDLKRQALLLGQKFFQDFNSTQAKVERELLTLWFQPLDALSSSNQSILSAPDCEDKLILDTTLLFNQIGIELPQSFQTKIQSTFSEAEMEKEFVIVVLSDHQMANGTEMSKMISLQNLVNAMANLNGKQTMQHLISELAEELQTDSTHLFMTTKENAVKLGLPYSNKFESVALLNGNQGSSIFFNLSLTDMLASLEAGSPLYTNDFINQSYDVLGQGLDRNTTGGNGELLKTEDALNSMRMTRITFFESQQVEVAGLIDGGLKPDSKDKDLLDSIYGQSGISARVNDFSVSIVTQFDSETIQARSLDATYDLISPTDEVGLSLRWQLSNDSKDSAHFGGFDKVQSYFGLQFRARF